MTEKIGIGIQEFDEIRDGKCFYIDKTYFIREWWESKDKATLIARPRRFGKTLNMSMLKQFFSVDYKDREDLFEGLSIWEEKEYRQLQGTYPVISLSFANIKEKNFPMTRKKICQLITKLYEEYSFLLFTGLLGEADKRYFRRVSENMDDSDASLSLYQLSDYLYRYYGKKVIILLDEYDTPMQEAYVNGFWDELASFTRSLFNSTFKTNPYLERAIMTGITRVSKESVFSDLNNLEVVTTTSNKYMTAFGFTEEEVFNSLEKFGYGDKKEEIKKWYDGFVFGKITDIYKKCTKLDVHVRHPYAGDLVFSAFSGSHQDAIRKGMKARKERNEYKWEVPYLPIDPHDLGREYKEIIRINSQSGKGGAIYIMENEFGFNIPKNMHKYFGKVVKEASDKMGKELSPQEIYDWLYKQEQ